jgi:hypothetical protein
MQQSLQQLDPLLGEILLAAWWPLNIPLAHH